MGAAMQATQSTPHDGGDALGRAAARASTQLRARLVDAPYQTLGVALGLGVIVGAGMWRLFARSMLEIGARTFMAVATTSNSDQHLEHQEESR